jgi:DNA-directed RNA polymerase alpha subunit
MNMTDQSTTRDESPWPRATGRPAQNALAAAGYTHLEQLTEVSEAELLKLHGMGPKAVGILREALAQRGLRFAASKPE